MDANEHMSPESIFPQRIRQLRLDAGLTQEEMGACVRIGKVSISQYENGLRKPSPQTIVRYASYFRVSTDYLLGLSDVRLPANEMKNAGYTVSVRDDALAFCRVRMGDRLRLRPQSFAAPGDIVEIEREGKRHLAMCLTLEGSPAFLVDPLRGLTFLGKNCRVLAVAAEIILQPRNVIT